MLVLHLELKVNCFTRSYIRLVQRIEIILIIQIIRQRHTTARFPRVYSATVTTTHINPHCKTDQRAVCCILFNSVSTAQCNKNVVVSGNG